MVNANKKQLAVVTGASSGIGEALASALAARGFDLVLVARSTDKLQALCTKLVRAHGISARAVHADLSTTEGALKAAAELELIALPIDLLVNNAGFGVYGDFTEATPERLAEMLAVNTMAPTILSRAVLPRMKARGAGTIINMASSAGLQAVPYMSAYAASKSYVVNLSEALWAEARRYGVRVAAVCPGPVQTPFLDAMGEMEAGLSSKILGKPLSVDDVVKACLHTLDGSDQPTRIVGRRNYWLAQGNRFMSRRSGVLVSERMFRPPVQRALPARSAPHS